MHLCHFEFAFLGFNSAIQIVFNDGKGMSSKERMLIAIVVLIAGGFLMISLSSFFVSRQNSIDALVSTELPLASDTIYSEVQRDLIGPQIVSSVMANDSFVRDWINEGELDDSKIAAYLTEIAFKYNAFTAFLVVDESANFYSPLGFMRKVSEQEPRDEWYYRTKQNSELIELNVDPAEFEDDQLTIFFNVRMLDQNGDFMAAIGLGLNRDLLNSKLENYRERYGHQVHFLTPEGEIFLHEQPEYEGLNIQEMDSLRDIADELLAIDGGQIRYRAQRHDLIVHVRYIEEIDLILLVEADVGLATQSLYRALFWNFLICVFITLIVLSVVIKTLGRYQSRLEFLASKDELTGVSNRQALNEHYHRQMLTVTKSTADPEHNLFLLLIDIDNFKQINDKHGHVVGDIVLKKFGRLLIDLSPKNSFCARWGGEEFALLLKNKSLDQAYQCAELIRAGIESSEELKAVAGDYITVSIGITECTVELDFPENFQKADKLMYKAKAEGRNRSLC